VVGVVLTTGGGEIAGAEAITGEGEIAGMEVMTGEGDAGMEVVEILRLQAVKAIEPIPINNLKYFTLNLT